MLTQGESTGKWLHFIVRHEQYAQTIGYGYFLDQVLAKLNQQKPASAKELLESTALLMLNPDNPERLSALPTW